MITCRRCKARRHKRRKRRRLRVRKILRTIWTVVYLIWIWLLRVASPPCSMEGCCPLLLFEEIKELQMLGRSVMGCWLIWWI
ncbi:hypothetical protein Hanom_Chr01g00093561 [Helianthus anomalus]